MTIPDMFFLFLSKTTLRVIIPSAPAHLSITKPTYLKQNLKSAQSDQSLCCPHE